MAAAILIGAALGFLAGIITEHIRHRRVCPLDLQVDRWRRVRRAGARTSRNERHRT